MAVWQSVPIYRLAMLMAIHKFRVQKINIIKKSHTKELATFLESLVRNNSRWFISIVHGCKTNCTIPNQNLTLLRHFFIDGFIMRYIICLHSGALHQAISFATAIDIPTLRLEVKAAKYQRLVQPTKESLPDFRRCKDIEDSISPSLTSITNCLRKEKRI